MQLPTIAADVPLALGDACHGPAWATLASLLLDAGLVHRRDIVASDGDFSATCLGALDRWLRSAVGGRLHYLTCNLHLDTRRGANAPGFVTLVWDGGWRGPEVIGAHLQALQDAAPGLGAAALQTLSSQEVCPLYTPVTALTHACLREWFGEDDEDWAIDQYCSTDEEREAMREQMVTRAMFDEAFPEWALSPPGVGELDDAGLALVAAGGGWAGAVAAALSQARSAIDRAAGAMASVADLRSPNQGEFVGWAAILRWADDEYVTERVHDDVVAAAGWQSRQLHFGQATSDAAHPAQLRRLMDAMRDHCRAVRAIDTLLAAIFTGE